MVKPIILIRINNPLTNELRDYLVKELFDYHVLTAVSDKVDDIQIECFNDSKGLKNIDIEKLIKDFNNGK